MQPAMTSPETLWLVAVVPVALTVAAMLLVIFLLRDRLSNLLIARQVRAAQARRQALPPDQVPDEALFFSPEVVPVQRFLTIATGVSVLLVVGMALLMPNFPVFIVAPPSLALLVWGLMQWYESRYVADLDKNLVETVGRLSAMLRSGNGFRQAVDRVTANMEPGPLAQEWRFLLDRQGVPLLNKDGVATAQQVVAALSLQTPSRRHGTFLNHLSVAVGQSQDVLVQRVQAAYDAMQASERRMDDAKTQLAQMRYSGIAVGGAGLLMALYLTVTQWDRVVVAYSSPLGAIVGVFVVASLMLPIIGGFVLARADDVDY